MSKIQIKEAITMADKKTIAQKYAESKAFRLTVKIATVVSSIGAGFAGGWFAAKKIGKGK